MDKVYIVEKFWITELGYTKNSKYIGIFKSKEDADKVVDFLNQRNALYNCNYKVKEKDILTFNEFIDNKSE